MASIFGVDNTGLAFGGYPLSPGSVFGSIPSYADNASSVKPLELTKGMDPATAILGVAGLGTSIAGMFGQQSAAQQQAKAVEDAAAAQLKEAKEAAERNVKFQLAQVGLNLLASRYKPIVSALERGDAARAYVQRANIEANNPSLMALRSVQNFDQRLNEAFNKAPVGWRDDRLSFM